jgi:hypothetical protein
VSHESDIFFRGTLQTLTNGRGNKKLCNILPLHYIHLKIKRTVVKFLKVNYKLSPHERKTLKIIKSRTKTSV